MNPELFSEPTNIWGITAHVGQPECEEWGRWLIPFYETSWQKKQFVHSAQLVPKELKIQSISQRKVQYQ
jgi:hypothetical protein